jgi:glycosyltransferase involved in cell wall biosynthesis
MSFPSPPLSQRRTSVALTTFNGQLHLEALLNSIARQTLLPAELVVCDDASTDGTIPLLENFSRTAPFPVRIHRNPTRLGVLDNFHQAFALCTGDFIAYCDQDDVWATDKIAKCQSKISQPGVVLVSHRSRLTDPELNSLGIVQPDGLESGRFRFPHYPLRFWCLGHQMVFSRKLLATIDRFRFTATTATAALAPVVNCFDGIVPIVAGMVGDSVFIREDLVDFRRHKGAVSFAGNFSADNRTDSSKATVNARLAVKRLGLINQREVISGLQSWLSDQGLERSNEGGDWAIYALHIQRLLRDLDRRLAIYQGSSLLFRARAFAAALANQTYRDSRRNGAGYKQMFLDLMAVLRPVPASRQGPATNAMKDLR